MTAKNELVNSEISDGMYARRFADENKHIAYDKKVVCDKCGRGEWHEQYRKKYDEWFKDHDRFNDRQYPKYPKKLKSNFMGEDGDYKGCSCCGGFGILATRHNCNGCEKPIWYRPDPMTWYDGKIFNAYCGTEVVCTMKETICSGCFNDRDRNQPEPNGTGEGQKESGSN